MTAPRPVRSRRWGRRLERAALHLACAAIAVFILAPFAWMVVSSLSGEAELTQRELDELVAELSEMLEEN